MDGGLLWAMFFFNNIHTYIHTYLSVPVFRLVFFSQNNLDYISGSVHEIIWSQFYPM
jgi:hypothetical protein